MREIFFYIVAMLVLGYFLSFQWTRVIVDMESGEENYVVQTIRVRDLFQS